MRIIEGNKTKEITKQELLNKIEGFNNTVIDIGTGDGRYVYKNAKNNEHNFYIGMDPSESQLRTYSKKAVKNKLLNTLYVVGSIELLPEELLEIADTVIINFPWGSLLGGIAKAENTVVENIAKLLKQNGNLQITFGYSENAEPSETERLDIKEIDLESLEKNIVKKFEEKYFKLEFIEKLEREDIFEIESSWAKKLKFGQERDIFQLTFIKK